MSKNTPVKYPQNEQREIINGKPFFGVWIGKGFYLNISFEENWMEDENAKWFMQLLRNSLPRHLEIRNETFIYRSPYDFQYLFSPGSLAIKGILWGRAFEVMRCFKKGKKRMKKVYRSGKRKRVFV